MVPFQVANGNRQGHLSIVGSLDHDTHTQHRHMAMGQKPRTPSEHPNCQFPLKFRLKGVVHLPQMGSQNGFDHHSHNFVRSDFLSITRTWVSLSISLNGRPRFWVACKRNQEATTQLLFCMELRVGIARHHAICMFCFFWGDWVTWLLFDLSEIGF